MSISPLWIAGGVAAAGIIGLSIAGIVGADTSMHVQQPTDDVMHQRFDWFKPGPNGLSIATGSHVAPAHGVPGMTEVYTDYTPLLTVVDSHKQSGTHTAYQAGVDMQGDGVVTTNELRAYVDSFDTDGAVGIAPAEQARINSYGVEVMVGPGDSNAR